MVFLALGKWHMIAQQTDGNPSANFEVILKNRKPIYYAGEKIEFSFNTTLANSLICHTAYGNYICLKEAKHAKSTFLLPPEISEKSGVLDFKLLQNQRVVYESSITILPNEMHAPIMETYFGPPSIAVDDEDYAMLVALPTDIYDNPLPDKTSVKFKNQYLNKITESTKEVANGFTWVNYFSPDTSGRMLWSAATSQSISKEASVEVYATFPINFEITYRRVHPYADGNQVITLVTNTILDNKSNVISDGTLVRFHIKKSDGTIIYTQASTVNGMATAQLLHPDKTETWQITAYVDKMAESKPLEVTFLSATDDFPVRFFEGNRKVSVGLIQSFLGQIIPDGTRVKMTIYQKGNKIDTFYKNTKNGMVLFHIEESKYFSGVYDFKMEALGITKEFFKMKL